MTVPSLPVQVVGSSSGEGPVKNALCGLVLLGLSACADSLDDFDITRVATAKVSGNPLGSLLGVLALGGFADMKLSDSQEFKNQGVKPHHVDSVKLSRLRLKVTVPASGQDLTFMKQLSFFAVAKDLPEVRVASGGPFAAGVNTVELTLDGVELKPYVVAEAMSLTTKVDGQAPKQDTTLEATVTLHVDVNVSGVVTGN